MSEQTTVSVVKCPDYDLNKVLDAVRKAVELAGGLEPLKRFGKNALLKPNIIYGVPPEKAVTTHPVFLDAVITVFREAGFVVTVGEAPPLESFQTVARKSGIMEVIQKHRVSIAEFNEPVDMRNPEGALVRNFQVAKEVRDCDFIVSLPKLKNHTQMFFTGAMKNLFGVLPGMQKSRYHLLFPEKTAFADMLVDLNVLIKPAFAVMDGIVSMEGKGPSGGDPYPLGLVLASADVLALDIIACEIIGYRYQDIPVLKQALERMNTPWVKRYGDIRVAGEKISSAKPRSYERVTIVSDMGFFKNSVPGFLFDFIRDVWVPRPFFNGKKCNRCGRCIEMCSAGALTFVQDGSLFHKKVRIEMKKCIRCYCCHEICPAKAVRLNRIFPFL